MKPLWLALVAPLLALPPWQGRVAAIAAGAAPVAAAAGLPSVAGAPARGVVVADGLLSVDARDIDVAELLAEVARRVGFEFRSSLAAPDRISLRFARLPLDQGLLLILSGQHYAVTWSDGAAAAGARQPASLRIFDAPAETATRASAAGAVKASAMAEGQGLVELLEALRRGTSQEREQAAADLGQLGRPGPAAAAGSAAATMRELAAALADGDVQVRLAAIESLGAIGGDAAALALEVALRDLTPRVREAAVDALGDIGGAAALALLERSRADEVGYVREAADEAIERQPAAGPRARRHDVNASPASSAKR